MGFRTQHLEQARENRRFAQHLVATYPSDFTAMQWAVTMTFYCALHCVEAHLATFGEHSRDHTDRETQLVQPRFGIPRSLFGDYRYLKTRSMQARYHMRRFTPEAVQQSVFPYLARVTLFVQLDSS